MPDPCAIWDCPAPGEYTIQFRDGYCPTVCSEHEDVICEVVGRHIQHAAQDDPIRDHWRLEDVRHIPITRVQV